MDRGSQGAIGRLVNGRMTARAESIVAMQTTGRSHSICLNDTPPTRPVAVVKSAFVVLRRQRGEREGHHHRVGNSRPHLRWMDTECVHLKERFVQNNPAPSLKLALTQLFSACIHKETRKQNQRCSLSPSLHHRHARLGHVRHKRRTRQARKGGRWTCRQWCY